MPSVGAILWSVGVVFDVYGGAGVDVAILLDGEARVYDFVYLAVCGGNGG